MTAQRPWWVTQSVKDEVSSKSLWPRSFTVQKQELHQATSQALYLCKQCIASKNRRSTEALRRKWDTFQLSTHESIWEFNRQTGESIWKIKQQFNPRHLHVLLKWKSTGAKKQAHTEQILMRSSAASEQIWCNTKWQSGVEEMSFHPMSQNEHGKLMDRLTTHVSYANCMHFDKCCISSIRKHMLSTQAYQVWHAKS